MSNQQKAVINAYNKDHLSKCISNALMHSRRDMGITIDEISSKSSIGLTTLYGYEQRETIPTVENLFKLADILGFSIDDIAKRYKYGAKKYP